MRLIIISNRAPVSIRRDEKGDLHFSLSSGGLASGLRTYVEKLREEQPEAEILWMGWPGADAGNEPALRKKVLKKFGTYCVFVEKDMMEKFYEGFCNKTLWPLFHYFPVYTSYETEHWNTYIEVNKIYCRELLKVYRPGDIIWVHDYHLMLLPAMIREQIPNATIGFFLHIPFPSYEVFRLLPSDWRIDILNGLYGSDLIGFHTHDYRTYFLRSTIRILGLTNNMGFVNFRNRNVKVESFPMGIDYDKYSSAVALPEVQKEIKKLKSTVKDKKIILSIDRQDYSKGILNRLRGYEYFLQKNPEMIEKIMMIMIVIPSRVGVENYMEIKSNIDELVGSINGKYSTLSMTPILYQYRSLSFAELIALYSFSCIGLITPLRDGMNLVAKEFIACKTDQRGVLILSEMAGARDELIEAIIINPNNVQEIAQAINQALMLSQEEQRERILPMQQRLQNYNIFKWSASFLGDLQKQIERQRSLEARVLPNKIRSRIVKQFHQAESKVILLDYDGTLQNFTSIPSLAVPSPRVLAIMNRFAEVKNLDLVLISGRDWQTLEKWFGTMPINIVAEHGLFIKQKSKSWKILKHVRRNWKTKVLRIMKSFSEKLPGSFVEQKDYSIAFHYRRSDPDLASLRISELINYLDHFSNHLDFRILPGNYVIEARSVGIDKGVAAMNWISKKKKEPSFIMAIGDDVTDEDLFRAIPAGGYTIKVGGGTSHAAYNLNSVDEVLNFLEELAE